MILIFDKTLRPSDVIKESGIDGPNGWTVNDVSLHNEYYQALMGGIASSTADPSTVVPQSPSWSTFFESNTGTGAPDRNYWTLDVVGKNLIMVSAYESSPH
jgi:hypothetical protein